MQKTPENGHAAEAGGNGEGVNVKTKILELIEENNGLELVAGYLQEIRNTYPDVNDFLEILAENESSGDYTIIGGAGDSYYGRYQIGESTLVQIGFWDDQNNWTELAHKFGVMNMDDFLTNEVAQEVAILFSLRWDYQYLLYYNADEYIGSIVEGIEITESGLIASYHLVGVGKTNQALRGDISWSVTKDDFETSAMTYIEKMGGFDLSCLWGGIE